jgi:hypothetical protein
MVRRSGQVTGSNELVAHLHLQRWPLLLAIVRYTVDSIIKTCDDVVRSRIGVLLVDVVSSTLLSRGGRPLSAQDPGPKPVGTQIL